MAITTTGKKAPDLGWRFTDAWLSMAGAGDKGIPNGKPVDEWGIRVDAKDRPVGASVSRGGAANGPAAKYALRKYMEWLRKYSPPGTLGMDFYTYLPILAKGNVAQQILLVYGIRPDHGRTGTDGQRRRHAQMAYGALAAWTLLGRGDEIRLSGLWFLDPV